MWCGFKQSTTVVAITCIVASSVVISDTVFAARQRNYTPKEFREVLQGLGYKVKVTDGPLNDAQTKKAIKEFQKGYKLGVDGKAGPVTQDFAANIVGILQANLNAVLKPDPLLPRNQFYDAKTTELIKQYQKKSQLPETGIADLALRQKLNEEAKATVGLPATKPTAKPKPTVKPKPTPSSTKKP